MEQKIEKYVQELLSQKVKKLEDENGELFVDLIRQLYKNSDILMFTFPFLDKIDDFINKPENIDLIEKMFRTIKEKVPSGFDIITSGNFGKNIYKLIENKIIDFDGNIVVVTGKVRDMEGEKQNPIKIIQKKYNDISNKMFIFVDDSYFTGETRDKINNFLKNYNSSIYKTFVFYTHIKPPDDVYTMYCFQDNHKGEKLMHKSCEYFEFIKNLKIKEYVDIIKQNIKTKKIKNSKELIEFIKKLNKIEEGFIVKYKEYIKG